MAESKIYTLDWNDIQLMNTLSKSIHLNNVIDGFNSKFFGVQNPTDDLSEYDLVYISDDKGISGLILKTGRFEKNRDHLTLEFSRAIELRFKSSDFLVIFNTFQSQLKKLYESRGILCISEEVISSKDKMFFVNTRNKHSMDYLLTIDVLTIYKSFFEGGNYVRNIKNRPKVYLMYDNREGAVKIGETKDLIENRVKGVSEPTKRVKDPLIECIIAWNTDKSLEIELHKKFKDLRIRGEWFDLRASDMKLIDKMTSHLNKIKLK